MSSGLLWLLSTKQRLCLPLGRMWWLAALCGLLPISRECKFLNSKGLDTLVSVFPAPNRCSKHLDKAEAWSPEGSVSLVFPPRETCFHCHSLKRLPLSSTPVAVSFGCTFEPSGALLIFPTSRPPGDRRPSAVLGWRRRRRDRAAGRRRLHRFLSWSQGRWRDRSLASAGRRAA